MRTCSNSCMAANVHSSLFHVAFRCVGLHEWRDFCQIKSEHVLSWICAFSDRTYKTFLKNSNPTALLQNSCIKMMWGTDNLYFLSELKWHHSSCLWFVWRVTDFAADGSLAPQIPPQIQERLQNESQRCDWCCLIVLSSHSDPFLFKEKPKCGELLSILHVSVPALIHLLFPSSFIIKMCSFLFVPSTHLNSHSKKSYV